MTLSIPFLNNFDGNLQKEKRKTLLIFSHIQVWINWTWRAKCSVRVRYLLLIEFTDSLEHPAEASRSQDIFHLVESVQTS